MPDSHPADETATMAPWSSSAKLRRPLIAAIIAAGAILLALTAAVGQDIGPVGPVPEEQSCTAARLWHLGMALRWSERDDQAYHEGAARAAEALGSFQEGACAGWQDDAMYPPRAEAEFANTDDETETVAP